MAIKSQFIESKIGNSSFIWKYPMPAMHEIAIYTFNATADVMPTFNKEFKNYAIKDVDNGNGTITRTIKSVNLPSSISFNRKTELLSVQYLDISNMTKLENIFSNCTALTHIDGLGDWDTSRITRMNFIFNNCSSLTSVEGIQNWNTTNVTNMSGMFAYCSNLEEINLSNWDITSVISTESLFIGCTSLESLDLSNWNTENISVTTDMFAYISTNIDWNYDGNNYSNFTLLEGNTGYSGTFPWNV